MCSELLTPLAHYLADNLDRTFDVSIATGLFDYISKPLPVLKKMRQMTTNKAIFSFRRWWTWCALTRNARLAVQNCAVFFYTKSAIGSLEKVAGFADRESTRVGNLHCVVTQVNGRNQQ